MTGERDSARRLFASRVAVLVLAAVSSYFALNGLRLMWSPVAYFGISIDTSTAIVDGVDPRDTAAGIRVGDRVELAAMPFRERASLYGDGWVAPGSRLTVTATRPGSTRTATFEAIPYRHPIEDPFNSFAEKIVAMGYILTAIVLVWSRPNPMAWGLAAFLIRAHTVSYGPLESQPFAAFAFVSSALVRALGNAGLIVFAARFPDNRSNGGTKYWYLFAAALFIDYMIGDADIFAPLFTTRPTPDIPDWWTQYVPSAVYLLVFVSLCLKLRSSQVRSSWRGFRWVVAGYGIGFVLAWVLMNDLFLSFPPTSGWPHFLRIVLMLAFPASVAYAIVRHRAFGLGYLANRTLAFVAFSIAAASTIVIGVWAASAHLTSTVGIGCAMFVAALVGMRLRASTAFVVRLVDRIFLRHRYEATVSLDRIRDAFRESRDANRVTGEIASTLELASLAVFSRTSDGGFVRKAAVGWPPETAWHLLPAEALTRILDGVATVAAIPDESEDELALPTADARPRLALALRRGERVERAVLVGSQRNGATLDRDVVRSLRDVFDDAVFA